MNRKKIAAIIVFGLMITTCSTPANGKVTTEEYLSYSNEYNRKILEYKLIDMLEKQAAIEAAEAAEAQRLKELEDNTSAVKKALKKLNNTVGKTWYVFSGSTPSGWDCSGLTMWFYKQIGVEVTHRASVQAKEGTPTKEPKPGDLVVFRYTKTGKAYHVGIYIGDDLMIHAPRKGQVTRIEHVEQFSGKVSDISYVRFIETN